jgi:hypothetical protein
LDWIQASLCKHRATLLHRKIFRERGRGKAMNLPQDDASWMGWLYDLQAAGRNLLNF